MSSRPLRFAFRADASIQIGTGHIMRCLTLADELRRQGHACIFICRDHEGHLEKLILDKGYEIHLLPNMDVESSALNWNDHAKWLGVSWEKDAEQTLSVINDKLLDWLVVDHYALDSRWEKAIAPATRKIMVIDDLADRSHCCAILLDQTYGKSKNEYRKLVDEECKVLCGSKYALLRPEFAKLRATSIQRRRSPRLKNILVNMGGVDKDNYTAAVIKLLSKCDLPKACEITAVMGSNAPWYDDVVNLSRASRHKIIVEAGVSNMAELMVQSDFAIGALGSTVWERCCLGLPSAMFILADNQKVASDIFRTTGAALIINDSKDEKYLVDFLSASETVSERLKEMTRKSLEITDGDGAERVCSELINS